eukprot:gene23141-biopygen15286
MVAVMALLKVNYVVAGSVARTVSALAALMVKMKVGLSEKMLEKYWGTQQAAVKGTLLDVALADQMDWQEAASSVKMMDELKELTWAKKRVYHTVTWRVG